MFGLGDKDKILYEDQDDNLAETDDEQETKFVAPQLKTPMKELKKILK